MAWQAGLRQGRPDVVYFSEYDLACSQIGAAERLSKIRTSGLADQLRRAAVERTIGAHWMSIDELVPALHGRGHIELLDDEWLPASAFLTRSSDRDLDPFLQSVAMGDLADVLARLKHNTVHVGQDSWSVLLSCYKCVVSYCERHLPHWQPEGAALFLTWRWHGSLPKTVEILEHRSPGKAFVAMDRKLDGAATGTRWLHYERVDERVAQVVADALRYGERQLGLYQLRAWVPMVHHVHILIYPEARLSRIAEAVKNHAARQAHAILGRTGSPFWQDQSYDHWVRGPEEWAKIVRYMEKNPVVAGLVSRAEDWPWSSAFGMAEGQARRPVPPK